MQALQTDVVADVLWTGMVCIVHLRQEWIFHSSGAEIVCCSLRSTIHAKLGPKMVTNWRGGGGGKAAKSVEYGRSYPVRTEEPVRREGATGPERPKRMRPDGAVCYVEGRNGGLGVKRRNVQQGEQPGRPPGRPPEG